MKIIKDLPPKGNNRGKRVLVKCHCGKEFEARKSHIASGHTTSCGCDKGKRKPLRKHPRQHLGSHRVTKPKRVYIPEPDIDEQEYKEQETARLIEQALEISPHLNEELLADSLSVSSYALRGMDPSELKNLLESVGAI